MKHYMRLFLSLGLVALLAGAASSQGPASDDARYRIGLQDVLDIQVFKHPELNMRASVNPNGMIYLYRLAQPVKALCRTERELSTDIEAAYKVSHLNDPRVNVTVAEQKSQSVSVIGAVQNPGRFFVNKRVHLLELLALAGGPNKESGTRLVVARAGSSTNCQETGATARPDDDIAVVGFKLRDIQEGRKSFWMQPGDIVSVSEADVVYVYGNVQKPGQLKVREPITLTQAIASAEGVKSASEKDRIRILRQKPDSLERDEIVLSLNEIEKGRATDPYLEPNDIVAVSKDGTKAIMNGLARAISNGIPSLFTRVPIP